MIGTESYCLSEQKNVDIGNWTSIAGGCIFHCNDNHAWIQNKQFVSNFPFGEWFMDRESREVYPMSGGKGGVTIGNDVWVGEGCQFMSGVHIGDGAIVAAGSIVTKDVPAYTMVAGNPAKVKYYKYDKETIEKLLKIQWWDWGVDTIKTHLNEFKDVKSFVETYG